MAKRQGKVGQSKSQTIAELPAACSDEGLAVDFMERQRWGDAPCCPHCGDTNVYKITGRDGKREKHRRWRCRGCGKLYSARTGTVYEESRIPMRHWCFAFWRSCTSKKGVSALEIRRQTGLSYKSALFMLHRVRFAMAPTDNGPKLTGTVEADETWIGGKPRHRMPQAHVPRGTGKPSNAQTMRKRHAIVFAALQRGGQVRVRALPSVTARNLRQAVLEHIDLSAHLMTDEANTFKGVGPQFAAHDTVNHSEREYARGDVTTNTIESFFATLKRGIHGIYHNVSKRHLQRYLDEFEFRYNHRKLEDGDRVVAAIRGADGKRLAYHDPVKRSA